MTLMDMTMEDLSALLQGNGQPAFRARQIEEWLLRGKRPEEMTNIPKALRAVLGTISWGGAAIARVYKSNLDDTEKYLFRLEDGALVEGVLMRYHHGNTLCLSTQAGCRMGCAFCASTSCGLERNLSHGEMLSMVAAAENDVDAAKGKRGVTNIVLMGSGEPLDNYDNVLLFLKRATAQDGLSISPRNISLSTCGLVPEIYRLMEEAPPVTLCISLHAHSDAVRDKLLPINRKYPIKEVVMAAKAYAKHTGRRVIFEYALIEGVNSAKEDAAALAKLLKNINCHINLIPLNPVEGKELKGVTRAYAAQFMRWLTDCGASATVRREMGTDIEGACGQLRRRVIEESGTDQPRE